MTSVVAAVQSLAVWVVSMVVVVGGPLLVKHAAVKRRRSRIWIQVRHVDSPAAREARHQRAVAGLDAGCQRLLAAIPQQRAGE